MAHFRSKKMKPVTPRKVTLLHKKIMLEYLGMKLNLQPKDKKGVDETLRKYLEEKREEFDAAYDFVVRKKAPKTNGASAPTGEKVLNLSSALLH